mgnify:CR=1 FL=1
MNDIILSTQNGEPVASSRDVAKRFGKEHKNVMQAVANLVAENSAAKSMFHPATFENRGKKYPLYLMNRDGFSLLAMGFTGKEAVQWKLKYIEAFNQMEKQLAAQHKEQQAVQDANIQSAIDRVIEAGRSWTRTPLFWTSAARTARTARPSICRSRPCAASSRPFTASIATRCAPWRTWCAAPRASLPTPLTA